MKSVIKLEMSGVFSAWSVLCGRCWTVTQTPVLWGHKWVEYVCQTCHSEFPEDLATDCEPSWNSKAWTVACHPLPGLGAWERGTSPGYSMEPFWVPELCLDTWNSNFPHCWNRINKCTPGQPSTVSFSECVICKAEMYSTGMTLMYKLPRHQNPSSVTLFFKGVETGAHWERH